MGLLDAGFKKCKLNNVTDLRLYNITASNLVSLERIIDYNIKNNIKLFRISSDIIPFGSHTVNTSEWWKDHRNALKTIATKIKYNNIRVSMHPGQYTVINSTDNAVVSRSFEDLKYHAKFLDSLQVDFSNKIVLHIGGVYGDKEAAIKRFKENYLMLPECVTNRLVIENDEKSFSVEDVLQIGVDLKIPVVFDNLHNKLNPSIHKLYEMELIKMCSKTWMREDGKQKIHYSQQKENGKPGAHSDTINVEEFLDFYYIIKDFNIDIMLEVKDKNLSAINCINCINCIV